MRTLKRNTVAAKLQRLINRIIIFDTTLRDGEQCPGASMNLREKLEVARQLKRLGADVIEAGFPVISDGDFVAVQAIARKVKGPTICALARCIDRDIDAAAKALKPAGKRARIHVFVGTSPTHMANMGKTPAQVLDMVSEGVKRAKSHVEDVEFSAMDATRTEEDFLVKVCEVAIAAGATVINIPDTVGIATPWGFGNLIRRLFTSVAVYHENGQMWQSAFTYGHATLSVHCHNDLGLAVANSLAAVRAGATQVECTMNGIGERAGNAALEEVVMAIRTCSDPECFARRQTGINTREILKTSRLVARMSGLVVQRSKAIVGENAFAHASGIHQDGVLKRRKSFEIMNPKDVGWGGTELPLTKHSGRAAVAARLRHLGYQMTDGDMSVIILRFKEIGDKKKFVYDDDLTALVEGHITEVPETWSLEYFNVTGGTGNPPTATVRLKNCQDTPADACIGDGPVDAVIKAIDRIVGTHGKLMDYSVRAVSPGQDAIGEVTLEVDFGNDKRIKGRNAATDVIEASARAYLNAVNRFLGNGGGKGK